jgi:hypothetical protein
MNPMPAQTFNDDLLMADSDREMAFKRFSKLREVIDFPEMRELFMKYERPAQHAKTIRHWAGIIAIVLGAGALVGVSLTPLYRASSEHWLTLFAGLSAILGIVSLLIGSVGALTGESKLRWLCNRLMTERLRQLQFQIMTCRIPEIVAAGSNESARQRFVAERQAWLTEFRMAYEGHLPAQLRSVMDDDSEDEFLVVRPESYAAPLDAQDPTLIELFSAYRLLRLEHQLQYANYKLRADESIFSTSSVRQLELLRNIGLGCIFLVFVAHLTIATSIALRLGDSLTPYIHLLIILTVIVILAVHTLEEGLQPGREVERYARYRSSMLSLLNRFDRAPNPEERIRIMLEAERTAYQEMRGFLKTNYDAHYVL